VRNAIVVVSAVIALQAVFLSGCASIVKGSKQVVTIESNVRGAEVKVNGELVGTTPFTGPIKRGSDTTVLLSKTGYASKTLTLSTSVEPVFWGNIIFGGVFGSTTDMSTGSMYQYAPATYNVDLVQEGK